MAQGKRYLAVDIGAGSGRVISATFDGAAIALDERGRFDTAPVRTPGGLWVDALGIHRSIVASLGHGGGEPPRSVAVDTWGVTPALLTRAWTLAGNPLHYRDGRTIGVPERVYALMPKADLYAETGLQELHFNTGFMLDAMRRDGLLDGAAHMLMLPDLFAFWLGGEPRLERTNLSTTQLYDPAAGTWSVAAIARMDLPRSWFTTPIAEPGTTLGLLDPGIAAETGLPASVRVVATASHDTAASVAAVPAEAGSWAYISSGTWSLMGIEVDAPRKTPAAMRANLTNEVGVGGRIRLLRNVMGLWLVQESRRQWAREGREWSHADLAGMAEAAPPGGALIDPDALDLFAPGDLPGRIRAACLASGQQAPETPGEIVRCALESLAQRYAQVLDLLEQVGGERIGVVHIVGGGALNRLLCQLTADACDRPVVAGPAESTALGNVLVQLMADGEASSLAEIREIARNSATISRYEPDRNRTRNADRRAAFARLFPIRTG
ncbi:MAG: rhamnulokinase family protein [Chloroflexota bacterium]